MEIILPADMQVRTSHDIALALQHKLEALDSVERAHVHVDYEKRSEPEHKIERKLLRASSSKDSTEGSPLFSKQNHLPPESPTLGQPSTAAAAVATPNYGAPEFV